MTQHKNHIRLLEELAANAVPAEIIQEVSGWRLRWNAGVTRRANSVLALHHTVDADLTAKLAAAEAFYARRQMPCRFQMCAASAPDTLDSMLAARGYTRTTPTLVQTAPLAQLLAIPAHEHAAIAEAFDETWLDAYIAGEGEQNPHKINVRRQMLQRVGPPAGYASVAHNDTLAAVAVGVVERGWLGIFSVATHPDARGRGLAGQALAALASWAANYGAANAYLQVMSTNAPALRLYGKLGFATAYEYWYREQLN